MPRAKRTGFLNMEAFAGELVQIKDGSEQPPPHLHVFSLSDFRNAVGKKWDKLGGLVEVAVESIIRRHVDSDKDIFTRLDAEIACLALPHTSRAETRTRVTAIARDITAHLFGDAVIDGRRPQVLAANLPLDEALTEEGEMDWHAIHQALARAGAALTGEMAAAAAGGGAGGMAAPHKTTLAELMTPEDAALMGVEQRKGGGFAISGGDERRMASAPAWFLGETPGLAGADAPGRVMQIATPQLRGADAKATTMRMAPMEARSRDADSAPATAASGQPSWYQGDGDKPLAGADAERRVLVMDAGRKGAGADTPMEVMRQGSGRGGSGLSPETSLTLVWTPTWVTSRRAVGAFHARIIRVDRDNAPPMEGVQAYDGVSQVEALTLDRFTATQAAKELSSLFYARQKLGLTVPIHWMSLSPKSRDVVRIPFESCPPDARRKFLKIEVFGLTSSIPGNVLRRLFEPLERVGCDVMARLPLSAVGLIPSLAHLRAVGVDLAELPEDDRVGDDELFSRLEEFRAAAKQAKVASYVWGVRRRSLISRLVSSGFSLVNGPGVMCDLSHPVLPSKGGQPG